MQLTPHRHASFGWAVVFCGLVAGPASAAGPHRFNVINQGAIAISSVFIKDVSNKDWGPNLLGAGERIGKYQWKTWTLNNCKQDVRVVYTDDRTTEEHDYDTCTGDFVSYR